MDNVIIDLEEYIAIKGIKALGNQFTTEKIKIINLLDPLPYEEPEINDVELVEAQIIAVPEKTGTDENESESESGSESNSDSDSDKDDEGQITLF